MAWLWFKFPDGMSEISVAQQNFRPELTDPADGLGCFRAPEHFSSLVLDGTGIRVMLIPPEGAPTNDPEPAQATDSNSVQLAGQVSALSLQVEGLRANLVELGAAYEGQKLKLMEANAKLSQFAEANPELARELDIVTKIASEKATKK